MVTLFSRKNSPVVASNCRPFRLTSFPWNVFERIIILGHQIFHIEAFSTVAPTAGRSVWLRDSSLKNDLSKLFMETLLMDTGDELDLCFLDFSEAFSLVNFRSICAKLTVLGGVSASDWLGLEFPEESFVPTLHQQHRLWGGSRPQWRSSKLCANFSYSVRCSPTTLTREATVRMLRLSNYI